MQSAAKILNQDNLPSHVEKQIFPILERFQTKIPDEQDMPYFNVFISLADKNAYKTALCNPKYGLLTLLRGLLLQGNFMIVEKVTIILWFLSRGNYARELLCSPELGLIPILFEIYNSMPELGQNIRNFFGNCSMNRKCLHILCRGEGKLLDLYRRELAIPGTEEIIHLLSILTSYIDDEMCSVLHLYNIPEYVIQLFMNEGPNPATWGNTVGYWSLNFLTCYSSNGKGRSILLSLPSFSKLYIFLMNYLKLNQDLGDTAKAFIILCNLLAMLPEDSFERKEFLIKQSKSDSYDDHTFLTSMISTVFYRNSKYKEMKLHEDDGFCYGIIKLRDFTACLVSLVHLFKEQSLFQFFIKESKDYDDEEEDYDSEDEEKEENYLISVLEEILVAYLNEEEEFHLLYGVTYEYAGGGGNDIETIENILECLLLLSFEYDANDSTSLLRNRIEFQTILDQLSSLYLEMRLERVKNVRKRNISLKCISFLNLLLKQ